MWIAMRIMFGFIAIGLTVALVLMWMASGIPSSFEEWASAIVVNVLMIMCIVPSAGLALESEI